MSTSTCTKNCYWNFCLFVPIFKGGSRFWLPFFIHQILTEGWHRQYNQRNKINVLFEMRTNLDRAFHPRSIAIVGASNNHNSSGYSFIVNLLNAGYQGQVYPVTPNWAEVSGLKTYPNLKDIPGPVDYVISCLPSTKILGLVSECVQKGVRFVHLFTARFAETGDKLATKLEKKLLDQVRKSDTRLIGPNCMGIYYPRGGLSFTSDVPKEPGKVGVFSQSGGNASELIYYSSLRGLRFSTVISYGNALDLNEVDFLEYLTEDDETRIIAGYVEGLKEGRAFFDTLNHAVLRKPVIILKGGRGNAGARAVSSHTAALAGSHEVWQVAMRQSGAIQVRSMEELIDLIVAFYFLPPVTGTSVGVAGGGGGKAVLSADEWEEVGFTLPPLPDDIVNRVKSVLPELWWGWIRNPLDVSILPQEQRMARLNTEMLRMMAQSPAFDLIAANIAVGGGANRAQIIDQASKEVSDIIEISRTVAKPVVAVLNTGALGAQHLDDERWTSIAKINTHLIEAGIPVYRSAGEAAKAIYRMVGYYQRKPNV